MRLKQYILFGHKKQKNMKTTVAEIKKPPEGGIHECY